MNFEPQKFFIGLMDFFSILLPGALLTYLLMDKVGPVVLGDRYCKLAGTEAWAAFLFASYLFGHLVFLLGSWLDEFYEWARGYTLNRQIARLARRGRLLPWLARALIWLVFKGERNRAVERAGKIRERALGSLQAKNSINTFQWCKALLNAESQASLAVVQRFEADSKFFRCFSVVLVLVLVLMLVPGLWPLQHTWPRGGIPVVLALLLLALWRYMEQRHKATNQAYWSVVTLTAQGGKLWIGKPAPAAGSPTHAGGVVFRTRRGVVQYLLVEAKKDCDEWVLPKGHIEESEDCRETAVREVREETGVWAGIGVINRPPTKTLVGKQEQELELELELGQKLEPEQKLELEQKQERASRRVAADLGNKSFSVGGTVVTVRFYLMQAVGRGLCTDKDRRHVWLPLKKALVRAKHKETRELLQFAEERRVRW